MLWARRQQISHTFHALRPQWHSQPQLWIELTANMVADLRAAAAADAPGLPAQQTSSLLLARALCDLASAGALRPAGAPPEAPPPQPTPPPAHAHAAPFPSGSIHPATASALPLGRGVAPPWPASQLGTRPSLAAVQHLLSTYPRALQALLGLRTKFAGLHASTRPAAPAAAAAAAVAIAPGAADPAAVPPVPRLDAVLGECAAALASSVAACADELRGPDDVPADVQRQLAALQGPAPGHPQDAAEGPVAAAPQAHAPPVDTPPRATPRRVACWAYCRAIDVLKALLGAEDCGPADVPALLQAASALLAQLSCHDVALAWRVAFRGFLEPEGGRGIRSLR